LGFDFRQNSRQVAACRVNHDSGTTELLLISFQPVESKNVVAPTVSPVMALAVVVAIIAIFS
jgi:hypothetical protein